MNTEGFAAMIDASQFASAVKHHSILAIWEGLSSGCKMMLVNDHDPKPLFYQFSAEYPGQFTWNYLENGPTRWQIEIIKA
jgi:uncharacterized protein (DUF2249 family)